MAKTVPSSDCFGRLQSSLEFSSSRLLCPTVRCRDAKVPLNVVCNSILVADPRIVCLEFGALFRAFDMSLNSSSKCVCVCICMHLSEASSKLERTLKSHARSRSYQFRNQLHRFTATSLTKTTRIPARLQSNTAKRLSRLQVSLQIFLNACD